MQVEAVNNDFRYMKVVRSGGIAGFIEEVSVTDAMRAQINGALGATADIQLDARESEELLLAVGRVVKERPAPSKTRGADMFQYDREIGWNGDTYRVHSVGLGADEALHGVISIAAKLIGRATGSGGGDIGFDLPPKMELHSKAPEQQLAGRRPSGAGIEDRPHVGRASGPGVQPFIIDDGQPGLVVPPADLPADTPRIMEIGTIAPGDDVPTIMNDNGGIVPPWLENEPAGTR